jgi:hypothetical protein
MYTRDQLAQTTTAHDTLARQVAQLELVLCPQQLEPRHVADATTLAQLTRTVATFYAQHHAVTITGTTVTDRRDNVQIQLFFTKNNDNTRDNDVIHIRYTQDNNKERTYINLIMSTTCVWYVAPLVP